MSKTPLLLLAPLAFLLLVGCPPGVIDLGYNWSYLDGGSTAATGGSGGVDAGTGGAPLCMPGMLESCYDGPAGTEGVGLCQAGTRACAADGASFGPCLGAVLPVLEDCGSGQDQDCDGALKPCMCGTTLWAKQFGDDQYQQGVDVAADSAGNAFVLGYFTGALDLGGATLTSQSDAMFVAKFDPGGQHLWSRGFTNAEGRSAAVDAGGELVVTGVMYDSVDFGGGTLLDAGMFVARFDAAGNHLWSRSFPSTQGAGARPMSIAADGAGNAIVTGGLMGSVDLGGGSLPSSGSLCTSPPCGSVFAVKFDAGGNHVWSHGYGGNDFFGLPGGLGSAVDGAGNVVLTGNFTGAINFGGATLATNWPAPACAVTYGCFGIFLAKLDAQGNHLWSRGFGQVDTRMGAVAPHGLAFDAPGNVVLVGSFIGSVDFGGPVFTTMGEERMFTAELDADGNHVWSRDFTGSPGPFLSLAASGAGGFVVAGGLNNGSVDFGGGVLTSAGADDVFFARFDATGAHLCSKRFGDGAGQAAQGVALDPMGNMLLTGYNLGSTDFGTGPLPSAGAGDAFLVKVSP
jgi:hypothetical protein